MACIVVLLCIFWGLLDIPIGICVLLFVFGGVILYLFKNKVEKKEHIIHSDDQ